MIDSALLPLAVLYGQGIALCLSASSLCFLWLLRLPSDRVEICARNGERLLLCLGIIYFLAIITLSSLKGRAHHTYADMATHLEILWRAGQGLGLTSPFSVEYHRGLHWFAAHFTPISYLLVPPFRLLPYPETLHVIQTLALLSTVFPLCWYARLRLGEIAAPWIGATFLLYPTLQYTNLYEFEYLRFSVPALTWAFFFLRTDRLGAFAFCATIALFVREEVGATVCAMGLIEAMFGRHRRVGLVTAVAGLGYSVLALKFLIPSFREQGGLIYLANYAHLGGSVNEIARTLLFKPIVIANTLLTPMKLANLTMLLLPVSFLPLLGWPTVLMAGPALGLAFLSAFMTNYSFILYYLSPAIPFLFLGAIDGMARVARWMTTRRVTQPEVRLAIPMALGALLSSVWFGPLPFSLQFWDSGHRVGVFYTTNFHRSNYRVTDHVVARNEIIAKVPLDARVAAEQPFLPHLFDRKEMLCFPDDVGRADHVLFDRRAEKRTGCQTYFLEFRNDPERFYRQIENDAATWTLLAERDGVKLFRRKEASQTASPK